MRTKFTCAYRKRAFFEILLVFTSLDIYDSIHSGSYLDISQVRG